MESESESRRFRLPKSSSQESDSVKEDVPVLTKYKNNWAVNIFAEWLTLREVQSPVLDCGRLFKDYELHKVQAFSADIAEMNDHGCSFAELLVVQIRFSPLGPVVRKPINVIQD